MPVPVSNRQRRVAAALAVAGLVLASPPLWAQDAAGGQEDPGVVVTRTVHPRIAYRGVPRQENPVHARATTFPARVFHDTVGGMLGELAGDELLGQHGSVGLAGTAGERLTGPALLPATVFGADARGAGAARIPGGPGASVGRAVGGATGGLGERISGGVMQALQPAAAVQGGGR